MQTVVFYGTMQELLQLLARDDDSVPLDVAALQLATIEYPDITVEPFLMLLDSYSAELQERVTNEMDGEEFIVTMNEYLFDELGFEGNGDDYYDPANSCLNEVLTRRKGIPITLSIVCIEVGRRLGRPLFGVALPGHFLLQYDDGEFSTYIDPFNGGQLLTESDCYELARRVTGLEIPENPAVLAPASHRLIVIRMLNNLRSAYFLREEAEKALRVLDLLLAADPAAAAEYRQRGLVKARLQLYRSAKQDLEKYLQLSPEANDKEEILRQLDEIRMRLERLH